MQKMNYQNLYDSIDTINQLKEQNMNTFSTPGNFQLNGSLVSGWQDKLESMLQNDEGFRQFPYNDSLGVLTIGYGRNLRDRGISQDEGLYLLHNDILNAISELTKTFVWFGDLDYPRQCVLINMCFNIGINRLLKFISMLSAVQKKDYNTASKEMLNSLWAKQVPNRAERLAYIMKTGILA